MGQGDVWFGVFGGGKCNEKRRVLNGNVVRLNDQFVETDAW